MYLARSGAPGRRPRAAPPPPVAARPPAFREEVLGYVLGPQRVPRQQDALGEIPRLGANMNRAQIGSLRVLISKVLGYLARARCLAPRTSLSQVVQDSRGGPGGLVADLDGLEDEPLRLLRLAVAVEAGHGVASLDAVAGLRQELDARGRVYSVGLSLAAGAEGEGGPAHAQSREAGDVAGAGGQDLPDGGGGGQGGARARGGP